jgi:hypothetical protein
MPSLELNGLHELHGPDPRERARRLAEIGELRSFASELRKSLDGDAAGTTAAAPAIN